MNRRINWQTLGERTGCSTAPATEGQKQWLQWMGVKTMPKTMGEAHRLIQRLRGRDER